MKLLLLISLLIIAPFSYADKFVDYSPGLAKGTQAKIKTSDLHPTQFALGMGEVDARAKKLRGMGKDELKTYLQDKLSPVIIGPNGMAYLIDRHHLARAVEESKNEHIYVEIKENWSQLSQEEFEAQMVHNRYCWLFDEDGNAMAFSQLPEKIKFMRDDPFRTLVWQLREDGVIDKTTTPFAEFLWANALRSKIEKKVLKERPQTAYAKAKIFAQSDEAKTLPGFHGLCDRTLIN